MGSMAKGIHVQLVGHIHDKPGWWEDKRPRPRIYNVSVERTEYRPVTLEEILEINTRSGKADPNRVGDWKPAARKIYR